MFKVNWPISHTMFTVRFSSPCRREDLTTAWWVKCFKSRKLSWFKSSDNRGISLTGFKGQTALKFGYLSQSTYHSYIANTLFFEMLQFYIKIFQAFIIKTWGKDCSFLDKAFVNHAKYKILGSLYPVPCEYDSLMLLHNVVTSPACESVGVT